MCGFAGFMLDHNNNVRSVHTIQNMIDAIDHRGPDDEGVWHDLTKTIFLGHKRLAIMDLSDAGHQPMHSFDQKFTIVFNGEIYNHLEIRNKLKTYLPKNFLWKGTSDTETLITAISLWGVEKTLNTSIGMFAFALWDHHKKVLILARDRMGEKPLYFGRIDGAFLFASELKSIVTFPSFNSRISKSSLKDYLKYNYIPAPASIYEDIYKLIPGSIAVIDERHKIQYKTYWTPKKVFLNGNKNLFTDDSQAINSVKNHLSDAISAQMLADVPLGAFLSGGIDSSLVAALMQSQSNEPIKTFTIAFQDSSFNEAPFAKEVADHLGTDHHEILVTDQEVKEVIPKLAKMYDEPFADSSQLPTHLVCKAARQKVTVALSGDAADELFGGYNRYTWAPRIWKKVSWIPFPVRKILGFLITALPAPILNVLGIFLNLMLPKNRKISRFSDKLHKMAARLITSKTLNDFCNHLAQVWHNPDDIINMVNYSEKYSDDKQSSDFHLNFNDEISQMMYRDLLTYLPDDILCKVDRAAMSVSLETRVPFLDHRVVELSSRIPFDMKIRDNKGKWILRELLYKYVPEKLIDRPKTGFGIPIGDWIRGPLKSWADNLLTPEKIINQGYFHSDPIQKMWKEHLSGDYDWTPRLWGILMFQSWLEETSIEKKI